MAKNVDATPIMEHELSLIQQDVNSIVHHLKQKKENDTFTFHILSNSNIGERDSIGVNKSHISCYRIEARKLTIFFSGNDEPIVFQSYNRSEPNYIVNTDQNMYMAFIEWFDSKWDETFNSDDYND